VFLNLLNCRLKLPVVKVVCISRGALSSKGQKAEPRGSKGHSGVGFLEGHRSPPHQLGVWGLLEAPEQGPGKKLVLFYFELQKITNFMSTTYYFPVILTANFNDFALTLGMTVFDEVRLKSQQR